MDLPLYRFVIMPEGSQSASAVPRSAVEDLIIFFGAVGTVVTPTLGAVALIFLVPQPVSRNKTRLIRMTSNAVLLFADIFPPLTTLHLGNSAYLKLMHVIAICPGARS